MDHISAKVNKIHVVESRHNLMAKLVEMLQSGSEITHINKILDLIRDEYNCSRVFVMQYDWEHYQQSCIMESVAENITRKFSSIKNLSLNDIPWIIQRISSGIPVMINNMDMLPDYCKEDEKQFLIKNKINSLILLPVLSNEYVNGAFGITMEGENQYEWTLGDYQWLSAYSATIQAFINSVDYNFIKDGALINKWRLNFEKISKVYNLLPVGVFVYNKKGYLIDYNDKGGEIFAQTTPREYLGKNLFKDDIISEKFRNALLNYEDINITVDYQIKKESWLIAGEKPVKNLMVRVQYLYNPKGELEFYVIVVSDNTETRNLYHRIDDFKRLFNIVADYSNIGYVKYNLESQSGFTAGKWYSNLGEDESVPLNKIIGVYSHVHEEDRKKLIDVHRKIINRENSSFSGEIRVVMPDGKIKWLHKCIIVEERSDSSLDFFEINFDITHYIEMEKRLHEAIFKAEESNRLKSAFLANMSHEIRTPLNAIVGFSNILAETDNLQEKQEFVKIINSNNDLLLQLINEILDLSKIESGAIEFHYADVEINQALQEVAQLARLNLSNDKVSVVLETALPSCKIVTDRTRFTQLVMNLVNNAIKFTEQGSIRIGYNLPQKDNIYFYVSDTGIGIQEPVSKHIFERFMKANPQTSGTGLGLTICSTIVEKLGGKIGFDTKEGEGSTFWFTLPYA